MRKRNFRSNCVDRFDRNGGSRWFLINEYQPLEHLLVLFLHPLDTSIYQAEFNWKYNLIFSIMTKIFNNFVEDLSNIWQKFAFDRFCHEIWSICQSWVEKVYPYRLFSVIMPPSQRNSLCLLYILAEHFVEK